MISAQTHAEGIVAVCPTKVFNGHLESWKAMLNDIDVERCSCLAL